MSDVNQKNIATHLSEKVQNDLVELMRHINNQGELDAGHKLVATEVAPDGDDGKAKQEAFDKSELGNKAKNLKLGDKQNDEVVREANKGKTYENLLLKGNRLGSSEKEKQQKQILEILNEVEHGEELAKNQTLKSISNPSPVPNTEFDEKFFAALKDEAEFDEESQSDGQDEEDDDNENEGDGEDSPSLKETNPGYFKTILTKI